MVSAIVLSPKVLKTNTNFFAKIVFEVKTNHRKKDMLLIQSSIQDLKHLKQGETPTYEILFWDKNIKKKGKKVTYVTKMDWQACPEKRRNPNHTKLYLVFYIKKVQGSYKRL